MLSVDNKGENRNFIHDKNEYQVLHVFLTVPGEISESEFTHVPVLFEETVSSLYLEKNRPIVAVDATLGLGGHASEIVARLPKGSTFVGFDRDATNLTEAEKNVRKRNGDLAARNVRCHFVRSDFRELTKRLAELGIGKIDSILYDLGVSSAHYDDSERGFSFRFDGPLDMRFDRTGEEPDAADFVRTASEEELLRIFRDYGEEPKAYFIAKAIVAERRKSPITTTAELLKIIEDSSFDQKSKVRVFQAIRIAVNDEFGSIADSLAQAVELLNPEGRLSVITFHSLEDRLVKTTLKPFEKDLPDPMTWMPLKKAALKKVTKHPLEPSEKEIAENYRSRSAKLRILEKIR